MITLSKVKIFKKYNGNIDNWVRTCSKNEKEIINDNDWFMIDGFLQNIFLVRNGLTSNEFEKKLENDLDESCENQQVIYFLKKIELK